MRKILIFVLMTIALQCLAYFDLWQTDYNKTYKISIASNQSLLLHLTHKTIDAVRNKQLPVQSDLFTGNKVMNKKPNKIYLPRRPS